MRGSHEPELMKTPYITRMKNYLPRLKSSKFFSVFLPVIALLTIGFVGGYQFSTSGHRIGRSGGSMVTISREVPSSANVNFAQFWQVWDLLKNEYYDPSKLVPQQLVLGAIKGMVAAVGDPYTVYLNKEEQRVTQEDLSGSFSGVGIQIGYKGTQLAVIAPLPGSPAEGAGVQPGDLVLGIKDPAKDVDTSTDGMSLPEAVQLIRGTKGTKVTLALLREGTDKPIVVDLERQSIDVPSVKLTYEGESKDVAHIKILKFGAETKNEWDKIILEVLGKPEIKGVVLDVRNNPGGYLQAAVDVSAEFLAKGTVVVSEESGGVIKEQVKTDRAGRMVGEDVVILVNKGSASASEIMAGALRDLNGYKILGTTSFGKGTVQEPRAFPDGTGIHVTIRKWLTPNGTWVHDKGLTPDITVEDNAETIEDEQLLEAVSLVRS